jgi:hypothetical protein
VTDRSLDPRRGGRGGWDGVERGEEGKDGVERGRGGKEGGRSDKVDIGSKVSDRLNFEKEKRRRGDPIELA